MRVSCGVVKRLLPILALSLSGCDNDPIGARRELLAARDAIMPDRADAIEAAEEKATRRARRTTRVVRANGGTGSDAPPSRPKD